MGRAPWYAGHWMRCPVCYRSLEETRDAETRCSRLALVLRSVGSGTAFRAWHFLVASLFAHVFDGDSYELLFPG